MICCGRLAEMLYTAVIITACEVALPACIYYSTINPYTVQYLYDLENFFTYCPVWSALPAQLMDFGYSTNVLFLLIGSTIFSALLITLLYFLYKKRDGKDTGKPFVFSAYREIILILAVVTVTTYVLSDTSNLILLPCAFLELSPCANTLLRQKAHNSALCKMGRHFRSVYDCHIRREHSRILL